MAQHDKHAILVPTNNGMVYLLVPDSQQEPPKSESEQNLKKLYMQLVELHVALAMVVRILLRSIL